jgi:hypothetical protein
MEVGTSSEKPVLEDSPSGYQPSSSGGPGQRQDSGWPQEQEHLVPGCSSLYRATPKRRGGWDNLAPDASMWSLLTDKEVGSYD